MFDRHNIAPVYYNGASVRLLKPAEHSFLGFQSHWFSSLFISDRVGPAGSGRVFKPSMAFAATLDVAAPCRLGAAGRLPISANPDSGELFASARKSGEDIATWLQSRTP
jgi:hypothetical protein